MNSTRRGRLFQKSRQNTALVLSRFSSRPRAHKTQSLKEHRRILQTVLFFPPPQLFGGGKEKKMKKSVRTGQRTYPPANSIQGGQQHFPCTIPTAKHNKHDNSNMHRRCRKDNFHGCQPRGTNPEAQRNGD